MPGVRGPHWRTAKKLAIAYHFRRSGAGRRDEYDCDRCKRVGYYQGRNCPKHFPERKPIAGYRWIPQYTTEKGKPYDVPEIELSVCPAAIDYGEVDAILDLVARNRHIKEASGACMWGPDANRWPAWWFDAVAVVEQQRILEHNARITAETSG